MKFMSILPRTNRTASRLSRALASMALVAALAACQREAGQAVASPAPAADPPAQLTGVALQGQNSYADTVARVTPAVVTIRASRRSRDAQQFPFMDDPMFREFFGDRARPQQPPQDRLERGLGSGVVVTA